MDHKLYASPVVILTREEPDEEDIQDWPNEMPSITPSAPRGELDAGTSQIDAGDILDGPHRRLIAYKETWTLCSQRIKAIISEMHAQVTDDLFAFLNEAHVVDDSWMTPQVEVPVATLVGDTSVGMVVFDALRQRLNLKQTRRGPSFISVTLSPKVYSSTVNVLKAMIVGFTAQFPMEESMGRRSKATRLASHDIALLQAWYDQLGASSSHQGTRLVVFTPEVELCNAEILVEFIKICSLYVERLPIVLVFSTATSDNVLQTMLPVSARTKIYAEAFQLQRGLGALESVMRGLFLDEEIGIPFMLSASAYDALRNSYTRHEQSLHAFQSTLQLLVLDHFGLPNSVFCGMDMLGEPDEAQAALRDPQSRLFLDNLRSTIADDVRRLPESPLSAWWTSRASQRSKSSKAADYDDLLQFLSTARTEFNDHHTRLQFAIRLLRRVALEARTHAAEMKAGLSSLLGSAVRGSIFRGELPLIKEKIQQLPLERLKKLAAMVFDFCSDASEVSTHHAQTLLHQSTHWSTELTTIVPSTPAKDKVQHNLSPTKSGAFALPTTRSEPQVLKAASLIATELDAFFTMALTPVHDKVPLASIWILTAHRDPMEELNPAPRQSLVASLTKTSALIMISLTSGEDDSAPKKSRSTGKGKEKETAAEPIFNPADISTLPDSAVIFRRYLDSGRTINAYDWFESFAQAMEPERERLLESKDDDEDDEAGETRWRKELQSRFLWSLHELNWNGLLRGTGRKRDHLARTLWDPVIAADTDNL